MKVGGLHPMLEGSNALCYPLMGLAGSSPRGPGSQASGVLGAACSQRGELRGRGQARFPTRRRRGQGAPALESRGPGWKSPWLSAQRCRCFQSPPRPDSTARSSSRLGRETFPKLLPPHGADLTLSGHISLLLLALRSGGQLGLVEVGVCLSISPQRCKAPPKAGPLRPPGRHAAGPCPTTFRGARPAQPGSATGRLRPCAQGPCQADGVVPGSWESHSRPTPPASCPLGSLPPAIPSQADAQALEFCPAPRAWLPASASSPTLGIEGL